MGCGKFGAGLLGTGAGAGAGGWWGLGAGGWGWGTLVLGWVLGLGLGLGVLGSFATGNCFEFGWVGLCDWNLIFRVVGSGTGSGAGAGAGSFVTGTFLKLGEFCDWKLL